MLNVGRYFRNSNDSLKKFSCTMQLFLIFSTQTIFDVYLQSKSWLYDNSDQRQIRTKYRIRTKDKFGPSFEIRPKLFR